ncbi:hypothetical protein MKZ38_002342 [Zalerion maritima]|uniref:Uncharacterized protein n=1 Tax=Zalerion maritima TaxID=339359 RepID=A0AAD5WXB5_9PEZI|nr:hypothetical protein MKZ38_002342 [Zalerion maritima]
MESSNIWNHLAGDHLRNTCRRPDDEIPDGDVLTKDRTGAAACDSLQKAIFEPLKKGSGSILLARPTENAVLSPNDISSFVISFVIRANIETRIAESHGLSLVRRCGYEVTSSHQDPGAEDPTWFYEAPSGSSDKSTRPEDYWPSSVDLGEDFVPWALPEFEFVGRETLFARCPVQRN